MTLALSAVRHADEEFASPVTTPLTAARCTIGRGQDCDIVLEDPTRHVSRRHVTITRQGDDYILTVESRINPVLLNAQAVSAGQRASISLGDTLVIGEYQFNVIETSDGGGPVAAAGADPLAALAGPGSGPADFDAFFNSVPSRPASAASPAGSIERLLAGTGQAAPDPLMDVLDAGSNRAARTGIDGAPDHDPLLSILGRAPESSPDPLMPAADSGRSLLSPDSGDFSIDRLLDGGAGPAAYELGVSTEPVVPQRAGQFGGGGRGSLELDHVHDVHLPLPMHQTPSARTDDDEPPTLPAEPGTPFTAASDPLAALLGESARTGATGSDPLGLLFDPPAAAATPTAPSAPRRTPDPGPAATERSPYVPPDALRRPVAELAAAPAAKAATPAAAVSGQAAIPAVQAFLEGAGMGRVNIAESEAEAFLQECGATVRAAIEGLMGMLLARAKVKEELRASDRTMVAAHENNAFKLMESADEALRFVFDPATRTEAFLAPPKAVADACSDLQAHEVALVAGMRAALMGAIKRFEPSIIEAKFEKEGSKSLLANKKALLWDCFVSYYQQTERDADDHFDRVFGAAFLRAYQEQVRRLRS